MELADVVIEVLDARDPLPCRSQEVENFVRSCGAEKRIILLLNKIGRHLLNKHKNPPSTESCQRLRSQVYMLNYQSA